MAAKQRVAAVHLRFMWAACEGTVTRALPLSKAIGAAKQDSRWVNLQFGRCTGVLIMLESIYGMARLVVSARRVLFVAERG